MRTVPRRTEQTHADEALMAVALRQAERALRAGEAPVGACVARDGTVVVAAHNGVVAGPDATAHAEVTALRAACAQLRRPRLDGCVLYVTVEPCAMCIAACHYAGISRVVYGAALADFAVASGGELVAAPLAGITLTGGVLAADSRALIARWRPA